jgi:GrpB-like predicted nucleotidyltransferase (UPF0157 family)
MEKKLSGMSLEELWNLFPIILKEHNPCYTKWYENEKNNILSFINSKNIYRINHIGSSAVKGLISKPTVDILLELNKSCDISQVIITFKGNGWTLMSSEFKPEMKFSFNKGYTPNGFSEKVYHLQVRYLNNWDELYFRDYLMEHSEIATEYGQLKMSLWKKYEHNRDGYTEAKSYFINKYTKKAKLEYANRYLPGG